ncbi:penicillin acylase family protein [Psychrobium sp. MM17-31]|uniref:penicillin acylase family protein n=1 Tax=Psychrobium sp. MM17-31 TaxID=2917758 RepID=UPI001EF59B01|nr:penicillin acylase family protein [Psychrobium sp. MM17-31]MCG7532218.1 penicillin acylase family protein [Psychrobium sp. MM17-31]
MSFLSSRKIKLPSTAPSALALNRTKHGIMEINGNDLSDLLWGSGYAHAVDRYTQLLLMRIIGQGRLCELLEDSDENLAIDTFFRKANWHNNLTDEVDKLEPYAREMSQRYCDGINEGVKRKGMSMLKILGYKPELWTIEDSILISRMTGYLTLAQSQTEIEHFFVECVQAGVDHARLAELFPIGDQQIDFQLLNKIQLTDSIIPSHILWNSVLPRMMASNNWVISGEHTYSGKPILANDPHLEVNRLPNVWCEQILNCPTQRIKGMGMPGLPGIVIGRSNELAWGVTYSFMDSVDSWIEQCREGKYLHDDGWLDFATRKEVIRRKKHPEQQVTFYDNKHGVLAGDPNVEGHYLATRWSGANSGAQSLQAAIEMFEICDTKSALSILGKVESAWNWVVADNEGNIGYQMSGLMPKRRDGWNGFVPSVGWHSENDWQGYVDIKDLPRSFNPACGFLVTANNDLNEYGKASPINMPMGNYRAKRIADLIEKNQQHDVALSQQIQLDVYSQQAEQFLAILRPLVQSQCNDSPLSSIIADWDCCYDMESRGAVIFEVFYHNLRQQVFAGSQFGLGASVGNYLASETGVFIDFYQQFDGVLLNPESAWYEGTTQADVFIAAFKAINSNEVDKTWQQVNSVSFSNILVADKMPSFLGATTKPIPLRGGRATPSQGQIYRSANRKTSFAPTIRVIADMNEDVLHTSLAGGPSDDFTSKWYCNELDDWLNGRYKQVK